MTVITKEYFIEVTPDANLYLHWDTLYSDDTVYFPLTYDLSKVTEVSEVPEPEPEPVDITDTEALNLITNGE